MKKDKKAQAHERPTLEGRFCSDCMLLDIFLFFSHFPLIQIARLQIRLRDHKFIYKIANSLQDCKFICKIANLQTRLQCISKIANAFERSQIKLQDLEFVCKIANALARLQMSM